MRAVRRQSACELRRDLPALLACALLLAAALALACLAWPRAALAEEPAAAQVDIAAQVQTDGSLHVSEVRTIAVDQPAVQFEATWKFDDMLARADAEVVGVRVAAVNEEGAVEGEWVALEAVPFVSAWREEGGPSASTWSYDDLRETLYVCVEAYEGRVALGVDYVLENAVVAYADAADLAWRFAPASDAPLEEVSVSVQLPVLQGAFVAPGENVQAWGHGAAGGVLAVADDGSVSYRVSAVPAGRYAEAHVLFPTEWLSNLEGAEARAYLTQNHRAEAVAAEKDWIDQDAAWQRVSLEVLLGCAVLCALLLAVGLALYARYGREYEPDFKGAYWRAVPDPHLGPPVIGRLWRWNREKIDDLTAAALQLAHDGALRIEKTDEGEWALARSRAVMLAEDDAVAARALDALFAAEPAAETVSLDAIRRFGARDPQGFDDAVTSFQRALSMKMDSLGFFESRGKRLQLAQLVVAGVLVLLAGIAAFEGMVGAAVMLVATSAALAVLANYLPRRTERGNNVAARAKALRNWLRDVPQLDDGERAIAQAESSQLAVYAFVLGAGAAPEAEALQTALSETAVAARAALSSVESSYDTNEDVSR